MFQLFKTSPAPRSPEVRSSGLSGFRFQLSLAREVWLGPWNRFSIPLGRLLHWAAFLISAFKSPSSVLRPPSSVAVVSGI